MRVSKIKKMFIVLNKSCWFATIIIYWKSGKYVNIKIFSDANGFVLKNFGKCR